MQALHLQAGSILGAECRKQSLFQARLIFLAQCG